MADKSNGQTQRVNASTVTYRNQRTFSLRWRNAALGVNVRTITRMSVAVFDIDNTLVRGSTAFPAVLALAQAGLIERKGLCLAMYQQAKFRMTATEPDVTQIRARALAAIRNVSIARIDEVLDDVADRLIDKAIFPGSLQLLRQHLDRGDEVWLATAGPGRLASRIAERLGAHGAIGSEVEVVDGFCTGALAGPFLHGREKATAVEALATRLGWDRASLHAYSDSFRDLPMLRLAGVPNVVNPDSRLRRMAEDHGWSVHDTAARRQLTGVPLLTSLAVSALLASAAAIHRKSH